MIHKIFRPKNTLLSVAKEIKDGINNDSIYLSNKGFVSNNLRSNKHKKLVFVKAFMMMFSDIVNDRGIVRLHEFIIQIVALIFILCEAVYMVYRTFEATIAPIIFKK